MRGFDEYKKKLAENFVFLSRIERRDRILRELDSHARKVGGHVLLHQSPQAEALLAEVPDLVEYPSVVCGNFPPDFLSLPAEVLTTTLIHHQHYFPILGSAGLLPAFLAVTNTHGGGPTTRASRPTRRAWSRLGCVMRGSSGMPIVAWASRDVLAVSTR